MTYGQPIELPWYEEIFQGMLRGAIDIVQAPFRDWSMWWQLVPILVLWIVLELYFDMYKNEELGWNTALGNGISLFWITCMMMRNIFSDDMAYFTWAKFTVIAMVALWSLFLAFISFKHLLPARTTYLLASPTPVYFIAWFTILWSFGTLSFTLWVFVDVVLWYGILVGIESIIRHFMPEAALDESASGSDDSYNSRSSSDLYGSSSASSSDPYGASSYGSTGSQQSAATSYGSQSYDRM